VNSDSSVLQRIFRTGSGRPVALLILLILTLLSLLGDTPRPAGDNPHWSSSLRFALTQPFRSGREFLFDRYQRLAPRVAQSSPVTVIEIDEASLKQIGQWPWPRLYLAALIDAINAQQPAAIGIDIYMPEADATSPEQVAANLPAGKESLVAELGRLPRHDDVLATALRTSPSVLGAAGFGFQTLSTTSGLRSFEVTAEGGDPLPHLRHYPWVLASLPRLQAAAHGQAMLSVDTDDAIVRRFPLLVAVNDQVVPALAPEMLRVARAKSDASAASIEARIDDSGISNVSIGDLDISTESSSAVWLHFAHDDAGRSRAISAVDVLAGRIKPEQIAGKLVLIGITGSGLQDQHTTPLREVVPGIEIHAQLLESLVEGSLLRRPAWIRHLETLLLVSIGLLMIWLIPRRQSSIAAFPSNSLRIATGLVTALNVACLTAGFLLFKFSGLLFDAASLFIGYSALLASLVASVLIEIAHDNTRLAANQQRMREEAARVNGELAAARQIQLKSLPLPSAVFADETRFAVAALLEPAREVGGDLYDFFMLDSSHLFFVIGDVSGKGLPASLFMAVTKALAKSAARRGDRHLPAIMETANREISAENPESLFVTAVTGIYDATNGRLLLCNAGHDAPLCRRRNGTVQPLASASGPPMCVLDDFPYAVEVFMLAPGDTVLLFTDGLTEGQNVRGELYGSERLLAALSALAAEIDADALVAAVRTDLRDFVGSAEAADDLALLALQRR
jgi:serine phosphatase RsbU (regulator of sigma subunit)